MQISTLEYRNESDHDVCPYVHDRKVELIEVQARFRFFFFFPKCVPNSFLIIVAVFVAEQVPLGKDADEVSKRLLDVIRPYAVRLKNFGVILIRDYQTVSASTESLYLSFHH